MTKQTLFAKVNGWGGKRRKAGRGNLSGTVNHMARPEVNLKAPLHITLKLSQGLPTLRRKALLKEFKRSLKHARALGLYVLQFSLQRDHIHLFAEAENNESLRRGMSAVAGRFGKIVRKRITRNSLTSGTSAPDIVTDSKLPGAASAKRARVFKGRYHVNVLKTPSQTKNTLEYVLLNLSKYEKVLEYLDPFSSGATFGKWRELLGSRHKFLIKANVEFYQSAVDQNSRLKKLGMENDDGLSLPRSWLAKSGWLRATSLAGIPSRKLVN